MQGGCQLDVLLCMLGDNISIRPNVLSENFLELGCKILWCYGGYVHVSTSAGPGKHI